MFPISLWGKESTPDGWREGSACLLDDLAAADNGTLEGLIVSVGFGDNEDVLFCHFEVLRRALPKLVGLRQLRVVLPRRSTSSHQKEWPGEERSCWDSRGSRQGVKGPAVYPGM